jgi:hypothetical protein
MAEITGHAIQGAFAYAFAEFETSKNGTAVVCFVVVGLGAPCVKVLKATSSSMKAHSSLYPFMAG